MVQNTHKNMGLKVIPVSGEGPRAPVGRFFAAPPSIACAWTISRSFLEGNRRLPPGRSPRRSRPVGRRSKRAFESRISNGFEVNDVHKFVSDTTSYANERVEGIQVVAYQPTMIQKVSTTAAWLAFAFIVYATLSPIDARPVLAGPQFEHFAAFALMGLAFALAYPHRILLVVALVLISAFGLEALQLLTPDRHGRLFDALVKAAGGSCGIGIGQFAQLVLRAQINRTS